MRSILCVRCHRRERAPGLLVCDACVERLVAPKTHEPRWLTWTREHANAKDLTRAA